MNTTDARRTTREGLQVAHTRDALPSQGTAKGPERHPLLRSRLSAAGVFLLLAVAAFATFLAPSYDAQERDDAADDAAYLVIVHADNPVETLDRKRLGKMFLKKIRRWDALDESITPYDLDPQSEVREAFTRSVHGKSVSAIKSFWQRMLFSGRDVPPDELSDDAAMIETVGGDAGALGYVSAAAELDDSVKTVEVVDE